MTEKTISFSYNECPLEELSEDDRRTVEAAMEATCKSYAPYSKFHVGAAARLADGSIVQGCNQENAAYGATICAERTALYAAGVAKPREAVVAIAVAARFHDSLVEEPVSPCGICRQAMVQAEKRYGRPMRVLLCGRDRVVVVDGAKALLPMAFCD